MSDKVQVCEYIVRVLIENRINKIFAISGASDLRILDAIHRNQEIEYICPHHEQAGVMAAIAAYRLTDKMSAMLVTAGPGSTNTITGIASAYLDSVPVLLLVGQEKSEALRTNLRGKGVQGLDMVSIVKPITKYAVSVNKAEDIPYELAKALYIATSGRPGPVWFEVPQDIQPQTIDLSSVRKYIPEEPFYTKINYSEPAKSLIDLLSSAKRPVLWLGQGIRIAQAIDTMHEMLIGIKAPVLLAWNGADLLPEDHPQFIGRAGTYGNRKANFTLQNSDLIIALGTRLAIPQIGYDQKEFARSAKKVIVEIDPTELNKFQFPIDIAVNGDVKLFIEELNRQLNKTRKVFQYPDWLTQCQNWKTLYPPVTENEKKDVPGFVNSYHFIDRLSDHLDSNCNIVTDMGTSLTCTHAAIRLKTGQRLITSTGLGEMGFGLPAAIGIASQSPINKTTVFIGVEGSLQMNIQEFQTLVHNKLPIKIFILNNNGYLTIKHTERALFGENLSGCSPETGVSFPDLEKISYAYGIPYLKLNDSKKIDETIQTVLKHQGFILCDVIMPSDQFLGPKTAVKTREDGSLYSPPLEDLFPFLPREEFLKNMIIPPIKES